MLYKAWSVLSNELTQTVTNFTSFLKLLKDFRFLKGTSKISLNFSPYYHSQVPKYTGKAIAYTLYVIR